MGNHGGTIETQGSESAKFLPNCIHILVHKLSKDSINITTIQIILWFITYRTAPVWRRQPLATKPQTHSSSFGELQLQCSLG
jgi:hypothetical protein